MDEEDVGSFKRKIAEADIANLFATYGQVLTQVVWPEVRAQRCALIRAEARKRMEEKDSRIKELEASLESVSREALLAGRRYSDALCSRGE